MDFECKSIDDNPYYWQCIPKVEIDEEDEDMQSESNGESEVSTAEEDEEEKILGQHEAHLQARGRTDNVH